MFKHSDANLLLIWRERCDHQHSDTGSNANLLPIWWERGDNQLLPPNLALSTPVSLWHSIYCSHQYSTMPPSFVCVCDASFNCLRRLTTHKQTCKQAQEEPRPTIFGWRTDQQQEDLPRWSSKNFFWSLWLSLSCLNFLIWRHAISEISCNLVQLCATWCNFVQLLLSPSPCIPLTPIHMWHHQSPSSWWGRQRRLRYYRYRHCHGRHCRLSSISGQRKQQQHQC